MLSQRELALEAWRAVVAAFEESIVALATVSAIQLAEHVRILICFIMIASSACQAVYSPIRTPIAPLALVAERAVLDVVCFQVAQLICELDSVPHI